MNKIKVCFIEAEFDWTDRPTEKVPSYGFERIASYLGKEKYEIYYLDMTLADYSIEEIPEAEYYAFSIMDPNLKTSLSWIEKIKEKFPNSRIIVGGSSVADYYKKIMVKEVDIAIYGYAEDSFARILKGDDLDTISNLYYWKDNTIISTKKVYPPLNWDKIMPISLVPEKVVKYKNHAMVIGSLGCGYHCNFCNIIRQQPKLFERDDKYIIEEIKYRIKVQGSLSIQILHQNFCDRLPVLLSKLKEENLLDKIKSIAFNTRLDTFNIDKIKKALEYDIFLLLYTGVENFSDEMLKRLNKGYSGQLAKRVVKELIELENKYDNFDFLMTFIGFDKFTTKKEFKENMNVFNEIFVQKNKVKPIHQFFFCGLRKPWEEEVYEFPDNELGEILKKYKKMVEKLPNYANRREKYFQNVLSGVNLPVLVWAEFYIMANLLENENFKAEIIVKECINVFNR